MGTRSPSLSLLLSLCLLLLVHIRRWWKHRLHHLLLVTLQQLRQVVGDGNVQLVYGAALEEGAGALQGGELVQRVHIEEVLVRVGVGQVIPEEVDNNYDGGFSIFSNEGF